MKEYESNLNVYMAEVLDKMRARWEVRPEMLKTGPKRDRPDIIITEAGKPPLIIETEFEPARELEGDTIRKLSKKTEDGKIVRAVISIIMPKSLKENKSAAAIRKKLREIELRYRAKITDEEAGDSEGYWFPRNDFLKGTLYDISEMAQLLNMTTLGLDQRVREITELINSSIKNIPSSINKEISEILHQKAGEQTNKMAIAILMNAFIFQEVLSGVDFEERRIPTIQKNKTLNGNISIDKTIKAWNMILKINYYPIFIMAIDIIQHISSEKSRFVLDHLVEGIQDLIIDMGNTQDVTSTVYQKLIKDQKILAVFYTRPEAAAMMAAIACPQEIEDEPNISIGDFACGTGILLHAFYRRICQIYEMACRDFTPYHHLMMEEKIIGCDVLPSHVHLATSSLAGLHMTETFKEVKMYILKYGKQKEYDKNRKMIERIETQIQGLENKLDSYKKLKISKTIKNKKIKIIMDKIKKEKKQIKNLTIKKHVRCGSLELVDKTQSTIDAHNLVDDSIHRVSGIAPDVKVPTLEINEGSCDIVTMNPPYSSSNNPEQKGDEVHNPAFAGFETSTDVQKAMSERMKMIAKDIVAGGKMPIYFIYIADRMLKVGGTLAIVLPLTVVQGSSWAVVRKLLIEKYENIFVISSSAEDAAFSAETSIREIVLIATKSTNTHKKNHITSIVLKSAIADPLMGHEIGKQIGMLRNSNRIISDVITSHGTESLCLGSDEIASVMSQEVDMENNEFTINAVSDLSIISTALKLKNGVLELSVTGITTKIPMTVMDSLGTGGILARDITGEEEMAGGIHRGPFSFNPDPASKDYPAVNQHHNKEQAQMLMKPDGYYVPKKQTTVEKIKNAWANSGQTIIATHWTFKSQSCVAGFVSTKVLGGSTFPNFNLYEKKYEKAFVVWFNSIFGSLSFWCHGVREQPSRTIVGKTLRKTLPVLDFTKLSATQLKNMDELFEKYKQKQFKPLNKLDKDYNRLEMDKELIRILVKSQKTVKDVCDELPHFYEKFSRELNKQPSKKNSKELARPGYPGKIQSTIYAH